MIFNFSHSCPSDEEASVLYAVKYYDYTLYQKCRGEAIKSCKAKLWIKGREAGWMKHTNIPYAITIRGEDALNIYTEPPMVFDLNPEEDFFKEWRLI